MGAFLQPLSTWAVLYGLRPNELFPKSHTNTEPCVFLGTLDAEAQVYQLVVTEQQVGFEKLIKKEAHANLRRNEASKAYSLRNDTESHDRKCVESCASDWRTTQ